MISNPEKPKELTEEEIKELEEIRERADALRETDDPKEDSVWDLAHKEKEFREELEEAGMPKEKTEKMANKISDEILEKIEAKKESRIDALTGLGNRRAMKEIIPKMLSLEKRESKKRKDGEERREEKEASVLMIDFDHFKKVNDEFGHRAGDEALQKLATVIKETIRQSDFAFRYGGEEFVVLLVPANRDRAKNLAERIREKVSSTDIFILDKNGLQQKLNRTVSIGYCSIEQISDWKKASENDFKKIAKDMTENADVAVYKAKGKYRDAGGQEQEGRNRVVVFEEGMEKDEE